MTKKLSDPITLQDPIARKNADPIAAVVLRKPDVGTLRGLKLMELMRMDVATHCTLLPRITEPALTPDEIEDLDVADFTSLVTGTLGFFMSADELERVQAAAG
ncbi:MAG: phage tail assembly protein [Paracoccus sp. (in: a-proteobacteria)]